MPVTASVYAQSGNRELTRREGLILGNLFKGCDELTTISVDFDGTTSSYKVEWWRCGPEIPNWDDGEFPIHYVLIRPPKEKPQALPLALSNSGLSDEYFIDELQLVAIPKSPRQLLLITGEFYDNKKDSIRCLLGRVDEQFQCSASSEPYSVQQQVRVHEKSFFRKLGEYFQGR